MKVVVRQLVAAARRPEHIHHHPAVLPRPFTNRTGSEGRTASFYHRSQPDPTRWTLRIAVHINNCIDNSVAATAAATAAPKTGAFSIPFDSPPPPPGTPRHTPTPTRTRRFFAGSGWFLGSIESSGPQRGKRVECGFLCLERENLEFIIQPRGEGAEPWRTSICEWFGRWAGCVWRLVRGGSSK